jgi:putative ABC transport system permease protein
VGRPEGLRYRRTIRRVHDLRIAFRELRRSPIVAAVAVLSLALGIGANTAIFSLVNSLLVRALPISQPERLAVVTDTRADGRGFVETWTNGVWEQIRDRAQSFDACASWLDRVNIATGRGEAAPADAMWVSGNYFATLGVTPQLGRAVRPPDDVPGGGPDGPIAVISYEFWQRRFAGSASAVGTSLTVERVPVAIVGVTPPGFFGTEVGRAFDIAMPLNDERVIRGKNTRIFTERAAMLLTVLLRLRPEQSIDAATAQLRGIQPQIRVAAMPPGVPPGFREHFLEDAFVVAPAATGTSGLRGQYKRPLLVILAVVALVLVVACANVANLMLARAVARRHELSVRLALGASRARLARGPLMESMLLSTAGAALGLLFAFWTSRLIVSQLSTWRTRIYLDLSIDWRVLAFTALVTAATTIAFGVLPALRASSVAPMDAIREQGRSATDGRTHLSGGLVVAQVALSVVIVAAAGLFVRTFQNLAAVPLGFDADRVVVAGVNLSHSTVAAADRTAFLHRLADEAASIAGVERAAASTVTPIGGFGMVDMVHVDGFAPSAQPGVNGRLAPRTAYANFVTPGWFATYGMPILQGRDFTDADGKDAPRVIVVNEAFVRRYLADREPIGAVVGFESGLAAPITKTVVGVVATAAYSSVRAADEPVEYAPMPQSDFPVPALIDSAISIRASTDAPMRLARSVADTFARVDPDIVVTFRPVRQQVDAVLTQERLVATLSGFFGALALLLAGLGLYGVTAYGVARRRAEIGIRMALGSTGVGVVRLVVSRAALMVAVGIAIGVGISAWASRFVSSLLFGLGGRDPLTLAGAGATLVVVALAAAWLPAYRASRLDPASVLREN